MRGGTSRGPFLLADDLPDTVAKRDEALLAIMGAGHALQVDGIGGSQPQTSKVAIVSRSKRPNCDVDYLFAQVGIVERTVDTRPNCGNMLAGVGPFAIEAGLVQPSPGTTTVRIHNINTGANIDAVVQTPGGRVTYDGTTVIPGVSDPAARIDLLFRDFLGAKTGRLLPTGVPDEVIDGCRVTLIDSAVPMMLVRAGVLGLSETEPWRVENEPALMRRVEAMRVIAGERVGLGDVTKAVLPKVGIVGRDDSGDVTVAYLMPWQVHKSLAVTGAVCVTTAASTRGTILSRERPLEDGVVRLRHPSGVMEVSVRFDADEKLAAAGVIRTARRIFEGHVIVPAHLLPARKRHVSETTQESVHA
jgi:2-methylaconitate cis-trans-isomerase PrpF